MHMTVLKMTRSSILAAENLLDINSTNSVHRWLTAQQDISRAEGKILYKIISKDDELYVYIQSKDKFNINGLSTYGFVYVKDFEVLDILPEICSFDLQTFPYKTHKSKRYYIKSLQDRYKWLQKYFSNHGIELLDCVEYKQSFITMDKVYRKYIPTSSFKGTIHITDQNLAKQLLEDGIGRFKNYGLGLMLVK